MRAWLSSGERGAVAAAGAFMGIFLVGVLYHLAGTGEAVAHQERLQDAADEGAFTAAVVHARAMDTVAVVNQSMTVVMASIAALNLGVIAGQVCADFDIIRYPAGFCDELRNIHLGHHDAASPRLLMELREASDAGMAVVEAAPEIAADEAREAVMHRAGDSVRRAVLVPGPMAVRRRSTEPLCALANLHVFHLARIGIGIDMMSRLIGEGDSRVQRNVPHCEGVHGAGAIVTEPGNRPVGTEAFQVRMIVVGDARKIRGLGSAVRMPRRVIGRESTRRDAPGRDRAREPDPRATLAVAQAEYYSQWELANLRHDTERHSVEEDQFRMDWRARLRRFRVPTGGTTSPGEMDAEYRRWLHTRALPACGPDCDDVRDLLEEANDALH